MTEAASEEQKTTANGGVRHVAPWVRRFAPLLLASVLLRLIIVLISGVQTTPDSPGYVALADNLRHFRLADDPGERTPVYPLFLALWGLHLPLVRLAQMTLGIGITAALFWLAWQTTRSGHIAALAATCYGLSITAIIHEDAILTETLATTLLVALTCLIHRLVEQASDLTPNPSPSPISHGMNQICAAMERGAVRSATVRETTGIFAVTFAIGTVAGLIALTRPQYAFLPVVLLLPFVVLRRSGLARGKIAKGICCVFVPAFLLVGGWSAFNAARFGVFAPTILTGYNLSNHSGGFIEDAPEGDALLRDIYLTYRAETIAETGSHVTTIWAARPELLARTGLTNAQLSQAFASLSLRLFIHHPGGYAASVAGSWLRFWNSPGEWRWQGADNAGIGRMIGAVWMAQRGGFIIVNILFLLLTVGTVCSRRLRVWWRPSPFNITLCAIVWATSIVQALLETGSNTRFGVPTQPLVAYIVIVSAVSLVPPGRRARFPWRSSCDAP